jgi:hypothetical protein
MDSSTISLCFNGLNQLYYHPNHTNLTSLTNSFFQEIYNRIFEEVLKNNPQLDNNRFQEDVRLTFDNLAVNDKGVLTIERVQNELVCSINSFFLRKEISTNFDNSNILLNESILSNNQILHYIADVNSILI